jgi:hypothetical protein
MRPGGNRAGTGAIYVLSARQRGGYPRHVAIKARRGAELPCDRRQSTRSSPRMERGALLPPALVVASYRPVALGRSKAACVVGRAIMRFWKITAPFRRRASRHATTQCHAMNVAL